MRLTGVLAATAAMGLLGVGVQAGATDEATKKVVRGTYYPATHFDVSRPLSELIAERQNAAPQNLGGEAEEKTANPSTRRLPAEPQANNPDGALQSDERRAPNVLPTPIANFDGLSYADTLGILGTFYLPPDTNGAVGPSHYVEMTNVTFRIYSKTGTPLTAPALLSTVFTGLPGTCALDDAGDPIVLYDELANRWLLSQFTGENQNAECIAISTTGDPTGTYYRYEFRSPTDNFQDYPHLGVWPDAYYMTTNQFFQGASFNGTGAFAFDRAKMIAGNPAAGFFYVDLNIDDFPEFIGGSLPADLDGPPPPAGTPGIVSYPLADEFGDPLDALRIFEYKVDFAAGVATFSERPESPVAVAAYTPQTASGRNIIPQPAPATTSNWLDMIGDRLMHRLQYRNFGSYASLVGTHTVDVDTTSAVRAGVRYYQLKKTGSGGWAVNEQATYAPAGTESRWMGSAAMDASGNLAVGYSVSGPSTFPSVRYAARLAADPPNGLAQGEQTIVNGAWVQQSTSGRWGDYSALDVDPTDDCTFWYAQEYYSTDVPSNTAEWRTRVASFKLPGCTAIAKGTLTGTVKNATTSAAIAGANVNASGYIGTTNGSGVYSFAAGPGTYDMTASAAGYLPATATGVAVTAGATTTKDFLLTGVPVLSIGSVTFSDAGGNNNGVIDANECITVNVTLNNTGGAPATNVTANFLTTTPDVGTGPHAPYATIAAGSSGTNLTPFRLTTLPTFSAFAINLKLVVTTKLGTFSLPVTLPASGGGAIFNSTDTPLAIPDNNTTGITSTITISGYTNTVSDVNVSLHITHTWDGDVNVRLTAPNAATALLINGAVGGSGDNFGTSCSNRTILDDEAATAIGSGTAPFAGSYKPSNPLSVFDGVSGANVNSGWKLKVWDDAGADTGTLQCWSMILFPGNPGTGPCVPTTPEITAPLGGTKLTSDMATFTWTAGGQTGILEYWLRIGSTPGGFDIYPGANADGTERNGSQGLSTSKTIRQLPVDGRVIYAQLWYRLAAPGGWNLAPGIFAYSTISASRGLILTPVDGSTLTAGGETFTWTTGEGVQAFWLYIGTAPGLANRYNSGMLPGSQTSLSGVKVIENGETVYASLYSYLPQLGWSKADVKTYHAPNTLAVLTAPVAGSTISGSVAFTWTAAPSATMYWLGIGTTEASALSGSGALYYAGTAGTTVTVNSLPTSLLYVKLWTFLPTIGWQAPMSYTFNCPTGTFNSSVGAGDPTQVGRLTRDGVPSVCPSKAYPGPFGSTTLAYKTFNVVNTTAVPICAKINQNVGTCGTNVFMSAYNGSYNPASMSTNYLGDAGSSATGSFQVTIDAGGTLVLVATNVSSIPATPCTFSIAATLCP